MHYMRTDRKLMKAERKQGVMDREQAIELLSSIKIEGLNGGYITLGATKAREAIETMELAGYRLNPDKKIHNPVTGNDYPVIKSDHKSSKVKGLWKVKPLSDEEIINTAAQARYYVGKSSEHDFIDCVRMILVSKQP